jgi:voltage-gated potassium channel Kch
MDLSQVAEFGPELALYTPLLLFVKFAVLLVLTRLYGLTARSAVLTAVLMMPFDEIGYVIMSSAHDRGLLTAHDYTLGLIGISTSFVVCPLLVTAAYALSDHSVDRRSNLSTPAVDDAGATPVIIAGYGYVGRTIGLMLERAGIRYAAYDVDRENLAVAAGGGQDARYGDLTDPRMMATNAISRARLVIVTNPDFDATKRIIGNLKAFCPGAETMSAVQSLAQREELQSMGVTNATALMPEGTLGFGQNVLKRVGVRPDRASAIAYALKADDYAALRYWRTGDGPATHDVLTATARTDRVSENAPPYRGNT